MIERIPRLSCVVDTSSRTERRQALAWIHLQNLPSQLYSATPSYSFKRRHLYLHHRQAHHCGYFSGIRQLISLAFRIIWIRSGVNLFNKYTWVSLENIIKAVIVIVKII